MWQPGSEQILKPQSSNFSSMYGHWDNVFRRLDELEERVQTFQNLLREIRPALDSASQLAISKMLQGGVGALIDINPLNTAVLT